MSRREWTAQMQGALFVVTGLWPVAHLRSFEAVTGPKTDGWLVKTVDLLMAAIGLALLGASRKRQVSREVVQLGVGSAASLAAIDIVYVARRRISPIYVLDACLELFLVSRWLGA